MGINKYKIWSYWFKLDPACKLWTFLQVYTEMIFFISSRNTMFPISSHIYPEFVNKNIPECYSYSTILLSGPWIWFLRKKYSFIHILCFSNETVKGTNQLTPKLSFTPFVLLWLFPVLSRSFGNESRNHITKRILLQPSYFPTILFFRPPLWFANRLYVKGFFWKMVIYCPKYI